jgi:hypothetical protein
MENSKTITTEIVVNASNEKAWNTLFIRFGEIHLYNPNLVGSHFTHGQTGEVGCERQCNLDSKTFIREKILSAETMKKFTVDVTGGNMPMVKELRVSFEFLPLGVNQTKILLEASFTAKPAFMGILMKSLFKKRLTNMLIGLKYHLETGRRVSKETFNPVYSQFKKLQLNESFA